MRNDLTDVTLIVDRSGSMIDCRADAEGGVNTFIENQKKEPGDCLFSLVQFDAEYEFVHKGVAIKDVPYYTLVPRGWTALLDAVGRSINETGNRLAAIPEEQRPGLVVFVIVTDGQENSSHEFKKSQIREMIELQQNTYSWKFTFLGANQDAFAEAGSLGISAGAIANYAQHNSLDAFKSASANVSRMRQGACGPCGPQGVCCSYTTDERKAMQA